MSDQEMIEKIEEILNSHCDKPSENIMRMGACLIEIGRALEGKTSGECKRIMNAMAILHGLRQ